MSQASGTLDRIARGFARLLDPLEERLAAGEIRFLLADLGLQFPATLETNAALTSATKAATQRVGAMPALVAQLVAAIAAENTLQIIAKALELGNAVRVVIDELEKVANAIKSAGAGMGIPAGELNNFASEFPGRVLDYLVAKNLESIPGLAEAMEFIGALERNEQLAGDAQHPAFIRRIVRVGELTKFVEDPLAQLKARYQWGAPGFNGAVLLQTLQRLLSRANVPAVLDLSGPAPVLDALVLEIAPKLDVQPPGLRLKIADTLKIDNAAPIKQDDWEMRFVQSAQLAVGTEIILKPDDGVIFIPPTGEASGETFVEWTGGNKTGAPYIILGQAGSSRIEARQLVARAGVGLAWNSGTRRAEGTWKISGDVKGGKIVVSLAGADGFLGKILSGVGIDSDFEVGLGFSSKDGLFFHGSAVLEIQLPLHVALGPVEFNALTLSVGLQDGKFPIGAAVNIKAALGPLQAMVEQVGFRADLSLPPSRKGNLGPVDLGFAFKPPKGVGLSIDAGVIKGGGYLFIDPERGEYAGALELTFSGFIALKAIGLITTKMPDGSSGFSLLIIITAEFATGIQLGFGFTLLAVGGLLGLNRTMRFEPLMEGIRTGAINSIMFPKDVIANAPKIISDLRTIFPPEEGRFLIGPMAKIGWGTPTLISLSLGIIIEIPGNIAILGVLRCALPTDEAAIILLQINFAGAIEFDKKRLFFFASMFESRIAFCHIEGEMGVLAAFGDDANFVLSVGGFHPRFNPPPLPFPTPRRVSVDLVNTPVQKVRIEGYFAVTSNTAQFGARAELRYGLDDFNIHGHIAFDALLQFSPFYFIIEISASLGVDVFGAGLFSVRIQLSLEGPTPYRARGSGEISILFFDFSVDFDVTWGEERNTTLPPISVMPIFKAELEKAENWRAFLPAGNNLFVALRKMPAEEVAQVLHPVGVLRVSQRALPLELKLDTVGSQKPNDVNRLSLTVVPGGLGKKGDVFEQFAPAQFQKMDNAQKLSRPSYGPERGGLDLSAAGPQFASSRMVRRIVRYEEIIIDTGFRRFQRRFSALGNALFQHLLQGAAISKSAVSYFAKKKLQPFEEKIVVAEEKWTVAFQATNKSYVAESAAFTSEASARDYLQRQVKTDATLSDSLHVIPEYEKAA